MQCHKKNNFKLIEKSSPKSRRQFPNILATFFSGFEGNSIEAPVPKKQQPTYDCGDLKLELRPENTKQQQPQWILLASIDWFFIFASPKWWRANS